MNNLTDWINYELYPSLFEHIDRAFPEHNFKRFAGGWRSKSYIDGTPHKSREDKTVVKKQAPYCILEQGGEVINMVKYVMRRDGVKDITAIKTLADVAGLKLPDNPDFNREDYHRDKEKQSLLECCNDYFIWCLEHTTGARADELRQYLTSRGYSPAVVKVMELGYLPSQEKLFQYLKDKKGYSQRLIDEVLKIHIDTRIGSTHRLTIPYRSGGQIKGFKFRTLGPIIPKYLNSSGLDKRGGFFNILGTSGGKDIVIVEGELDSLHATAKGVENVVALGGCSISSVQVNDAKRRGARSFTICLDMEPGKEQETAKRVNSIIEVILGEGVHRVYVATIPAIGGIKTDPDRLLKESGVDSFNETISQALTYYEYWLKVTIDKYSKIEKERGMQPKDKDNLLDEVIETAARIYEPTARDQYIKQFTSHPGTKELGITDESISITVDRLNSTREIEAQAREYKKLISDASRIQGKGESDEFPEIMAKLNAMAYWKGVLIKDIINAALQEAITEYEDKTGEIKPIPMH